VSTNLATIIPLYPDHAQDAPRSTRTVDRFAEALRQPLSPKTRWGLLAATLRAFQPRPRK
jgi:hypothetical protein